jgi:glycerol-3-phosphate dehydrogenase
MNRDTSLAMLATFSSCWDIAVIGGGATGVGIAVDAASRGFKVCLLEQSDFAKGTSSRSTKLIHGGVRYLQQGNISLVMEALEERGILRANAPHRVKDLPFVIPNYAWWEAPFYGIGMKVYDLLAGRYGFGKSRHLSKSEVLELIPTLEPHDLRGGVLYHDGQFDDARLLIDLAHTATEQGAILLNYAAVTSLDHDESGRVTGLTFRDQETQLDHMIHAKCVINATGAFTDTVRKLDDTAAPPLIAPSQGVHVVLDRSFLPGTTAILVPRTDDGRVMFAIPWLGHTLVGTTDTPIDTPRPEPVPQAAEVDFILDTCGRYLAKHPKRTDVLSVFAGIRPLVRASHSSRTAALSRDHTIEVSSSGLISIAGGKWTTYRRMAEDCVDRAITLTPFEKRSCVTRTLRIHGSDAAIANELITEKSGLLHPLLTVTGDDVIAAVRDEMARTVEDVLARRTRALFLNARAAIEIAGTVAALIASQLNELTRANSVVSNELEKTPGGAAATPSAQAHLDHDIHWQREQVRQFTATAQGYL